MFYDGSEVQQVLKYDENWGKKPIYYRFIDQLFKKALQPTAIR